MPVGPIVQHWETGLDKFKARYSLDVSGVAGLFGSELVIAAMSSIPFCTTRRWLGWHNTPGSYDVARTYGVLARASVWDGLFPGENVEPSEVFQGIIHKNGPAVYGVRSGTVKKTRAGHFGYLLMQECYRNRMHKTRRIESKGRRRATAVGVTVVELSALKDSFVAFKPVGEWYTALAIVPIMVTILACIMCALVNDWVCLALIAFGALAHGLSCLLMGLGRVEVTTDTKEEEKEVNERTHGSRILDDGPHIIILLGENRAIKTITHGGFSFELFGEPEYHWIGYSAVLLTAQFFLQLILIPLATLYGQLMFIASLAASWLHTAILSSSSIRDRLEQGVIEEQVFQKRPAKTNYMFDSRATMAVFTLLKMRGDSLSSPSATLDASEQGAETLNNESVSGESDKRKYGQALQRLLGRVPYEPVSASASASASSSSSSSFCDLARLFRDFFSPASHRRPSKEWQPAWTKWKEIVLRQILDSRDQEYQLSPQDQSSESLDSANQELLNDLLQDTKDAFKLYKEITRELGASTQSAASEVMTEVVVRSLSSDAHHDASPDGSKFA
ncbi:hypothetical protein C8Q74DRAFT_532041 [Fomes fomentarius]|nr:hypothetical protein C8Q74DRAFT_532041 [Fomes fomentarius]